jgi:hypothetical protein
VVWIEGWELGRVFQGDMSYLSFKGETGIGRKKSHTARTEYRAFLRQESRSKDQPEENVLVS